MFESHAPYHNRKWTNWQSRYSLKVEFIGSSPIFRAIFFCRLIGRTSPFGGENLRSSRSERTNGSISQLVEEIDLKSIQFQFESGCSYQVWADSSKECFLIMHIRQKMSGANPFQLTLPIHSLSPLDYALCSLLV